MIKQVSARAPLPAKVAKNLNCDFWVAFNDHQKINTSLAISCKYTKIILQTVLPYQSETPHLACGMFCSTTSARRESGDRLSSFRESYAYTISDP